MDKMFDFGNKYKSSNADSFSFCFNTYEYLKTCFSLKARRFPKKLYSRADGSGFLKNIRTLTRKDGDKKRERECVKKPLTQKKKTMGAENAEDNQVKKNYSSGLNNILIVHSKYYPGCQRLF